jgi:hypothetical protein
MQFEVGGFAPVPGQSEREPPPTPGTHVGLGSPDSGSAGGIGGDGWSADWGGPAGDAASYPVAGDDPQRSDPGNPPDAYPLPAPEPEPAPDVQPNDAEEAPACDPDRRLW